MTKNFNPEKLPTRRQFCSTVAATTSAVACGASTLAAEPNGKPKLNYILSSAMYGYTSLDEIMPEVKKTGSSAINIWPKVHGNQREQINEMGFNRFVDLLRRYDVRLGALTCYSVGPFNLQKEARIANRLGGNGVTLICGAKGPKNLTGDDLKSAIAHFVEKIKPHVRAVSEMGCQVAVENHANSLISSRDSILWFAEMARPTLLGLAFAPHHLPQDADLISRIASAVGPKILYFYAQQYGNGAHQKMSQDEMLTQMPGRGPLDFTPILASLIKHGYKGYAEILMHPFPRGIPILETTAAITAEIDRSRAYLDNCLEQIELGS